eukprot:1738935-Prymnesium_polylepis.1
MAASSEACMTNAPTSWSMIAMRSIIRSCRKPSAGAAASFLWRSWWTFALPSARNTHTHQGVVNKT